MQKLTDKDIANHIKEINNNVTHVNFDNNYSYARKKMVVHNFDKIFQGILDADPSCTFLLSRYFHMDLYKDYAPMCLYTKEHIASFVMTADPYIDLLTLREMLRYRLVYSITVKELKY